MRRGLVLGTLATPEGALGVKTFERGSAVVAPEGTLVVVITMSCFRVKGVSCAAALQADAGVRSNRVVTTLRLQTLMGIYLALVNVNARVCHGIQDESNFTITPESTDLIRAHLITVAGVSIGGTLIDINALIIMSPEAWSTRFSLPSWCSLIIRYHSYTLVRSFDVDALVSLIASAFFIAFVDVFTFAVLRLISWLASDIRQNDIHALVAAT